MVCQFKKNGNLYLITNKTPHCQSKVLILSVKKTAERTLHKSSQRDIHRNSSAFSWTLKSSQNTQSSSWRTRASHLTVTGTKLLFISRESYIQTRANHLHKPSFLHPTHPINWYSSDPEGLTRIKSMSLPHFLHLTLSRTQSMLAPEIGGEQKKQQEQRKQGKKFRDRHWKNEQHGLVEASGLICLETDMLA